MYDLFHLQTHYSAADNILGAQFPTQFALLERYLHFFFPAMLTEVVLAKVFRLCKKQ